jgi:hypothetical protein
MERLSHVIHERVQRIDPETMQIGEVLLELRIGHAVVGGGRPRKLLKPFCDPFDSALVFGPLL